MLPAIAWTRQSQEHHLDRLSSYFSMHRRQLRPTLFPYTTLFRSQRGGVHFDRAGKQQSHTIASRNARSEEHTSELQSRGHLVCRLLLEKKKSESVRMMTLVPYPNVTPYREPRHLARLWPTYRRLP